MADVVNVKATEIHAGRLAETIRGVEVAELYAATGLEPLPILLDAVRCSAESWALYIDGRLAGLWGVVLLGSSALTGRWGSVWLLTSYVVERYPKAFWEECRRGVPDLFNRWDMLVNYIDARHEQAIRWAARLGFKLEEPAPYGVMGMPFRRFVATKEVLRVQPRNNRPGRRRHAGEGAEGRGGLPGRCRQEQCSLGWVPGI